MAASEPTTSLPAATAPAAGPEPKCTADTVVFRVDGRFFEVLREPVLSSQPDCLLAQMADERDTDAPIYVEGNGDCFSLVLDYLRRRAVHLPLTISKAALLAEARKLNVTIDPTCIMQETPPAGQLSVLGIAFVDRELIRAKAARAEDSRTVFASLVKEKFLEKYRKGGLQTSIRVSRDDLEKSNGEGTIPCLIADISVNDLTLQLIPWARDNGYKVEFKGPELRKYNTIADFWLTQGTTRLCELHPSWSFTFTVPGFE